MTAHTTIKEALIKAVENAEQPESLARRLASWLDALASGTTDLTKDREGTRSRLQDILSAIQLREPN